jgi:hypothetical protein
MIKKVEVLNSAIRKDILDFRCSLTASDEENIFKTLRNYCDNNYGTEDYYVYQELRIGKDHSKATWFD